MTSRTNRRAALAAALAMAALAACAPSKSDILARTEEVETRAQLRDTLGPPDDIEKLGPVEQWTYRASDGSVTFVIAGEAVITSMTGEKNRSRR